MILLPLQIYLTLFRNATKIKLNIITNLSKVLLIFYDIKKLLCDQQFQ